MCLTKPYTLSPKTQNSLRLQADLSRVDPHALGPKMAQPILVLGAFGI